MIISENICATSVPLLLAATLLAYLSMHLLILIEIVYFILDSGRIFLSNITVSNSKLWSIVYNTEVLTFDFLAYLFFTLEHSIPSVLQLWCR